MERIKLTKDEKQTLRNVSLNLVRWPDGIEAGRLSFALSSLEGKGFIRVAWASGHEPVSAELTDFGAIYLENNPHLLNPVDWPKVAAIASIVTAVAATVALFFACTIKFK